MNNEIPNLIERSYKLLFVIYAPLALLSYLINAIGGSQISFLSMFLFLVTIISVLLTLILVVRYSIMRKQIISMADFNQKAPYMFRHDFLIPFIFISVVSITTFSFLAYKGVLHDLTAGSGLIDISQPEQKTKIVLILALSNAHSVREAATIENTLLDRGASEIQGLSYYLRFSDLHGKKYDFELIDHERKYSSVLEEKIKMALSDGVRYFICTTSSISVPLARKFEELITETNTADNNPILLCTNTSSPVLETRTNKVYRFYPRSNEEAKVLAEKAKQMHFNKVGYIAIDDEYGRGAVKSFEQAWRKDLRIITQGVFLDPALSEANIIAKIQNSNLLEQEPDAIFIANYGARLQSTIRAIEDFPDDIAILGTTPLSVKFTQAQIRHILKRKRWYTCVPDTKAEDDITAFDLHSSFLFMTIQKLTDVIEELNKNPKATFHEEFTKEDSPALLNFEYDKRGDFNIDLRIDSTLIKNFDVDQR